MHIPVERWCPKQPVEIGLRVMITILIALFIVLPSKFSVNGLPVLVAECHPRDIHGKLINGLQIEIGRERFAIMQIR